MKNFPVIITHMKPSATNAETKIKAELLQQNLLDLKLVFPEQAEKFEF
jgi:hypothetical protein